MQAAEAGDDHHAGDGEQNAQELEGGELLLEPEHGDDGAQRGVEGADGGGHAHRVAAGDGEGHKAQRAGKQRRRHDAEKRLCAQQAQIFLQLAPLRHVTHLKNEGDERVDPGDADGGQNDEHHAAGAVQRAAVSVVGAQPAVQRDRVSGPQNTAQQRQEHTLFL